MLVPATLLHCLLTLQLTHLLDRYPVWRALPQAPQSSWSSQAVQPGRSEQESQQPDFVIDAPDKCLREQLMNDQL